MTKLMFGILAGIAAWSLFWVLPALSADCPQGVAKCKVLILTPEEEQALTGPNGILDIAEKGAFVALGGAVKYFREKIAKAPEGTVRQEKPSEDKPAK